ncbi:MAG: Asp-tRNA(Asn)/Glu-tRNA(Gln) amidotransferase subunit GatA [bacterium]
MDLKLLTIKKIQKGLANKEFTAEEIAQAVFDRINEKEKDIHAYLELMKESALKQAKEIDEKIKNNEDIGVLAGVPIAIKDNILVDSVKCTAASKILENYIAPYDATVIKKLKSEDAILIGKTNCDEFAMGSSTENSAFGPTKNPHDLERVPGGSSGGSAAAVVADECIAAIGSDTGGSIRQPASFCGAVGFKPTYGRVSRYGLMAYASSLDQIGPLAKAAEDTEIILNVIEGQDNNDSTSASDEKYKNDEAIDIKKLTIGIPKEYFVEGIDSKVESAVHKAISEYEKVGAKIVEISLPYTEFALASYYIICTAEASSNLARYDSIRYGLYKKGKNLLDGYTKTRHEGFGDEVKKRIMLGTYVLSAGYYDAYYLTAQKARTLIKDDFVKAFKKVDVIMTPTSPTTAFKIGEKMNDPVAMYLSDIYTVSVNLAGLPAVSIPCQKDGLPIGLQIIGNQFEDKKVLKTAQIYENISN